MEFPVKTGAPARQRTECAILPVFDDRRSCTVRRKISTAPRAAPSRSSFAPATLRRVSAPSRWCTARKARPRRAGCSSAAASAPTSRPSGSRRRSAAAIHALRSGGTQGSDELSRLRHARSRRADAARHSVETARASLYRFDELKSRSDPPSRLARLGLGLPDATRARTTSRAGIKIGTAIAARQRSRARPRQSSANVCTPSHLAEAARNIAKRFATHGGQGARRSRHAPARHGRAAVASRKAPTSRRD